MNPPDQPSRPELVHDWERRLDAELRQLPERAAPANLLPDVMAMVRARAELRARAWWRRPAAMWHPALRVTFGVAAFALLGTIVLGAHWLWPEVQTSSEARSVSAFGDKLTALWSAAHTVVHAIGLALQSILTPTRLAILGAVILTQIALLGAGAAALRATLRPNGAPHSFR